MKNKNKVVIIVEICVNHNASIDLVKNLVNIALDTKTKIEIYNV
jgi:sialic acid synthase SpsE